MSEASLELLAPCEDVWKFLAEPYHLPDWWPGITGVEPDLRGFAPGARWKVHATKRNVFAGRRSVETMLLVREIDLYERWSFHILEPKRDAEVRLRATGENRTLATVVDSRGNAKIAVRRLYDLVQTAARL
jgi:uncharacterized protein YndB with AHSA1/START domain